MTCSNCTRDIADGSEFCPYCGSKQAPGIEETARKLGATAAGFAQSAMGGVKEAWEASGPSPQHQQRQQERRGMPGAVVMTGSPVMSFSGIEVVMGAGQTPPMVVADEQTVHLAHTTRRLTPDELLARVQGVLAADEVPVDVRIVEAQWRSDGSERRPRLMAQLRDHAYQDIRMMLGVDYLGRWASVQMMLAVQPDPTKSWSAPMWTFIAMLFGALFGLGGVAAISDGQGVGFIGVLIGLVVFFVGYSGYKGSKSMHYAKQAADKVEKAASRLARNYKVDDMRLFCSAMEVVFQAVVDDIVSQGGEVTRVEATNRGFFEGPEGAPTPAPRTSDAAMAEV